MNSYVPCWKLLVRDKMLSDLTFENDEKISLDEKNDVFLFNVVKPIDKRITLYFSYGIGFIEQENNYFMLKQTKLDVNKLVIMDVNYSPIKSINNKINDFVVNKFEKKEQIFLNIHFHYNMSYEYVSSVILSQLKIINSFCNTILKDKLFQVKNIQDINRINLKTQIDNLITKKESKFSLDIKWLNINSRIKQALYKLKIQFLEELSNIYEQDLMSLPNFGLRSLEIIKKIMKEHSISFKKR